MTTENALTAAHAAPAAPATTVAAPAAPVTVALGDAPAAPAAPVETNDTPDSTQVGNAYEYEKTGDPGLDYALTFVGKLGFGHDNPAVAAAMAGDFGLLRAELAALGPKAQGYGDVVALAEQAYSRSVEKAAAAEKALGETAVKVAGSPERWGEVQRWASANAEPSEKTAINAALSAGGVQAKMAMEYLVRCYDKSTGSSRDPKPAVQSGASSKPGSANAPLTAGEYSKAVQELARTSKGRDIDSLPEYKALQQRRLASQRQGR